MSDKAAFESPDASWDVTRLLDYGSQALYYFEMFEARYRRWVGDSSIFKGYEELHELYYAQNGLDEQRFIDLGAALAEACGAARDQHDILNGEAQKVPSIWSGESASRAGFMIANQLDLANSDIEAVKSLQAEIANISNALRRTLVPKAKLFEVILESPDKVTYDGKTPEDVDSIISGAQGIGWSTTSDGHLLGRLKNIFDDLPWLERNMDYSTPDWFGGSDMEWFENHCKNWMNKFKDAYELRVDTFVGTCTDVNEGVRGQYQTIIDLTGGLKGDAYPCPQGVPAPSGQSQAPSGSPSGAPSGAPAGMASGAPAGMASGGPAPGAPTAPGTPGTTPDSGSPLSALTDLGTQVASSGLGTQLASGLGQMATAANEQISSTLEQLREQAEQGADLDGDGQPDDDANGEGDPADAEEGDADKGIELDGKEYKLELGPDGQLRLVVSGEDGEPQNYKLEMDAQGKPTLVPEEAQGESGPETGHSDTEDQDGTGMPGGGAPGAHKGTNSEDGEHRPQDYPAPVEQEAPPPVDDLATDSDDEGAAEPPPPPVDTGAQLADADPL